MKGKIKKDLLKRIVSFALMVALLVTFMPNMKMEVKAASWDDLSNVAVNSVTYDTKNPTKVIGIKISAHLPMWDEAKGRIGLQTDKITYGNGKYDLKNDPKFLNSEKRHKYSTYDQILANKSEAYNIEAFSANTRSIYGTWNRDINENVTFGKALETGKRYHIYLYTLFDSSGSKKCSCRPSSTSCVYPDAYFGSIEISTNGNVSLYDRDGNFVSETCSCSSLTKITGKAATCTADGYKDHYKCNNTSCNKLYPSSPAKHSEAITDLNAWRTTGAGKITKSAHSWDYNLTGTKITVTCTKDSNHTASLTFSASSPQYTGDPVAPTITFGSTTEQGGWTSVGLDIPSVGTGVGKVTVKYFQTDIDGNKTGDGSDDAFSAAGDYIAEVTYTYGEGENDKKVIDLPFSINKNIGSATLTMPGWTYGQTASEPEYNSSTNGNNDVIIQYKVKGADSSTYTNTKPSEAGEYTVTAVFAETENYNRVIESVNFIIAKAAASDAMKTASGNIRAKANSTATISFSGLPSDATFGTITGCISGVTPKIENNKLKLTVGSSDIPAGTGAFTVTVPVTCNNYNNYNIVVTVTPKFHDHSFTYSKGANNSIVATCSTADCDLDENKVAISLSAEGTFYSGSAATITINGQSDWEGAGLETPVIKHEDTSGKSLASAPTTVGTYYATIEKGNVKVKRQYRIEQAHGTNTSKWKYDSTNHWHPCFRLDCSEHKGDISSHVYDESTHKCECGKTNPDASIHTYGAWTVTKLATATTNGEREHACSICGHKETEVTSYEKNADDPTVDPNAGIIENTTDASKNGCGADVKLTKSEIIEKFKLTLAELSKVENGVDIAVNLEVEAVDSKSIPSADRNKAEKKLGSGEKIGQYLDINLFKIIGSDKSKVSQLNGKIKIEITLPSDVKNAGTDYFIIRVHDGVATKLELTHVSGDTYTFETDQFSTYALGYKTDDNKGKAPKTGDDNSVYDWTLLMIAGFGVMGASFFLKRKEEN